ARRRARPGLVGAWLFGGAPARIRGRGWLEVEDGWTTGRFRTGPFSFPPPGGWGRPTVAFPATPRAFTAKLLHAPPALDPAIHKESPCECWSPEERGSSDRTWWT